MEVDHGMKRALFIGELLIAIAAGVAGVLSWWLLFLLPMVLPPLMLAPVGIAKPDIFDRRVSLRRIVHGTSAMNAVWVVTFATIVASSFAEPERHLVPAGYEGWVLVAFDRADGAAEEYAGDRRVYRIPESGLLMTQASANLGLFGHGDLECVDSSGRPVSVQFIEVGTSDGPGCELSFLTYWAGSGSPVGEPPSDRLETICGSRSP